MSRFHILETYLTFLTESITDEKWDEDAEEDEHSVSHYAKVHGHDVKIFYGNRENSNKRDYDVEFTVNRSMSAKGNIKPHHALAIMKHIKRSVATFRDKVDPKSISYVAADRDSDKIRKKERIYKAMAGNKTMRSHKGKDTIHFEHLLSELSEDLI